MAGSGCWWRYCLWILTVSCRSALPAAKSLESVIWSSQNPNPEFRRCGAVALRKVRASPAPPSPRVWPWVVHVRDSRGLSGPRQSPQTQRRLVSLEPQPL
ncbi:ephrin-B1-like [Arapaima gigas]